MNKLTLAIGLSIVITAVLMKPVFLTPTIANGQCSAHSSSEVGSHSSSESVSGSFSCGTSTAAAGHNSASGGVGDNFPGDGKHGACESRSASSTGVNVDFDNGQGSSVSCSSHSP